MKTGHKLDGFDDVKNLSWSDINGSETSTIPVNHLMDVQLLNSSLTGQVCTKIHTLYILPHDHWWHI